MNLGFGNSCHDYGWMRNHSYVRNHSYENEFCLQVHFHANQSHFHKRGFALRLILKQRHKGTQKWPIHLPCKLLTNFTFSFLDLITTKSWLRTMERLSTTDQFPILLEHLVKHILISVSVIHLWSPINDRFVICINLHLFHQTCLSIFQYYESFN